MRRWGTVAALLVLLMTALWFKGGLIALPDVPASAAAGEFDTSRALARLARILGDQRPHPVDSAANDAVRERLIAELRSIGLSPEVTDDVACNGTGKNRAVSCARVRNVLARLGPPAGRPVMMVAHYDSTPVGPGAADDGIGVAVMLETAALLKDRPLRRPVLLLFNEGEEAGLIGARAFADAHPLAREVEAVVNLEARGVSGPALMFETSRPNGAAVAAFARSAGRPAANSASADFYRLIPNDTDVSVFRDRPWTILNFAIIGNETRYHSPGDTLAALDPKSVRHMGEQALAATAALAVDGVPPASGDRLYMDLLGRTLIVMPLALGIGLLVAATLLFFWLARNRRGGIMLATATVAVGMVDSAILGFLGQQAVGLLRGGGEYWRAHPQAISLGLSLSAFAACTAALLVLAPGLARDRLRIGYWLLFLLLGCGLSIAVPGAAIYFLAPPLVAGAAMLVRRWERPGALLAWILLFLTWGPLLHLSQVLLDFDNGWIFAAMAALILWPVLIEMKPLLVRLPRTGAAAAIAALAVLAWLPALSRPAYSEDRKQAFGIEYAWDEAEGKARWMVVNDGAPLPAGFGNGFERGVEIPWSGRKRWAAPAPRLPLAPPRIEKVAERVTPDGRLLILRLATNGADTVVLRAKPEAGFLAARAGARRVRFGRGRDKDDFVLRCLGRGCDGIQIALLLAPRSPVEATVMGIRPGLPAEAAPLVRSRPALSAPQYSPDSSVAVGKVRL
ncbi:MAG TPA: M20/M25/M40 family metallo-hydrolase [Allosphingosinicella sp.]|nr:M20/M25/M40 family metallo-hydrolase [Allosphingosinicella sp.]